MSSNFQSVQITGTPSGPDKPAPETVTPPAAPPTTDGSPPKTFRPEKFKTDEEWAKAYAELEQKQSGAKPTPDKPAADKTTPDKPDPTSQPDPSKDAAFQPFFQEFAEKGELSDDSFKALEAKGIDRRTVEQYIAGTKALQAQTEAELLADVGGKEGYAEVAGWAKANLSAEDLAAYNKAVEGDPKQAKLAIDGLHARYTAAVGRSAGVRLRGGQTTPAVTPFRSTAQLVAAMNDPKYKTDEAYRDEVSQRLAVSDI